MWPRAGRRGIAGAIIAVFAQRLVRKVCPECRVPHTADEAECVILKADPSSPPTIYKPKQGGCQLCKGQGYKGRISIAEILLMDEDLDAVIANGGSKADLKKTAVEKGFKNMKDDGILKVLEGITSLDELERVVDLGEVKHSGATLPTTTPNTAPTDDDFLKHVI